MLKTISVRTVHQELRETPTEVPTAFVADRGLRTPIDCYELLRPFMANAMREEVWCAFLDGRHRLMCLHHVSTGTATASLIHPREVFGPAMRAGAVAIVMAHNHPSGDPTPSIEDRAVTDRMIQAGTLLGITLLDHLVIGNNSFQSMRGLGPWPGNDNSHLDGLS